ncbi:gastrula zinc finger protein XlCGF7.1-like [Centruroides vittatus]|uniref:gastrula zinc finger protein XlCGF7.1-like n=1 Tax=Centruroides vittatus TaxID=120091 RepID=UPI003510060D
MPGSGLNFIVGPNGTGKVYYRLSDMSWTGRKTEYHGRASRVSDYINVSLLKETSYEERMRCSDKYCNKRFTTKQNLEIHRRTHRGERPFRCSLCDKCFTTKQNLQVHERSHRGEKPFSCPVCDKCFTTKQNLQVHERSHTEEKPFICDYKI